MKQPMARVVSHEQIAHGIYELTLFTPIADSAEPGQFVHVKIPGGGAHMLRRPISIARSEESTLTLIYQIKGAGTRLLSHVGAGEFIDVLGPLGNGFSVKNVNRALVVGGGMGAAPLENLLLHHKEIEFDAVLGFRNKRASYRLWYFQHLAEDLTVMTEDGSLGETGFVTQKVEQLLKQNEYDAIYACGPSPMLKALKKTLEPYPIPCYASLEERMGCGIGACLVCNCKIAREDGSWTYKRVCKDGPVFLLREVMLDE